MQSSDRWQRYFNIMSIDILDIDGYIPSCAISKPRLVMPTPIMKLQCSTRIIDVR